MRKIAQSVHGGRLQIGVASAGQRFFENQSVKNNERAHKQIQIAGEQTAEHVAVFGRSEYNPSRAQRTEKRTAVKHGSRRNQQDNRVDKFFYHLVFAFEPR